MATHEQHAKRYAEQAGTDDPHFYARGNSNVFADHYGKHDTIYSYGHHFAMARMMPDGDNPRGWWLVNGDKYSVTTSQHQSIVRSALAATKLPMVIVPFSAISRARINEDSMRLVEVLPDRYTWERRTREEAPADWQLNGQDSYTRNWQFTADGRWSYEHREHHLGEALFTATYNHQVTLPRYGNGNYVPGKWETVTAYFLSAFDDNEPGFGLYFLAELPQDAHPKTVAEAREALAPKAVKNALDDGIAVLRQGDVFAIAWGHATRDLPGPSKHSENVLGTNHQATEVRQAEGHTYARGWLRHRPVTDWGTRRRPEHRAVKLGDGKTWFEVVKNTVPEGRSWSISGNVD